MQIIYQHSSELYVFSGSTDFDYMKSILEAVLPSLRTEATKMINDARESQEAAEQKAVADYGVALQAYEALPFYRKWFSVKPDLYSFTSKVTWCDYVEDDAGGEGQRLVDPDLYYVVSDFEYLTALEEKLASTETMKQLFVWKMSPVRLNRLIRRLNKLNLSLETPE